MTTRWLYLFFGWLSFVVGIIGLFVPLLPTTPFMIVSAYCFSKSSERCRRWLLSLPHIGIAVQNWEKSRAISRKAKTLATVLIVGGCSASALILRLPWLAILALFATIALVLAFIWTRPDGDSRQNSTPSR